MAVNRFGEEQEDLMSLSNDKMVVQRSWIERNFSKRDCVHYIPSVSVRDRHRCGCGRAKEKHLKSTFPSSPDLTEIKWMVTRHTDEMPTDAFGTLEFQGGPHPTKAQYVRLSHDTQSDLIVQLLLKHWNLELPKLLISVHGGIQNFELQPKLKRVFRKGLLKAANTTGAWIITGGTNTGVMRHVGDALGERSTKIKNTIVTIGIAPWGVVENREDLLGKEVVKSYHTISHSGKTNYAVLNNYHSYYLLVDNGTVGRYGAEIQLRKRLEKYISQQKISTKCNAKGHGVPLVCVVLEGGVNTIRTVLEYVTDDPPVPVVVCDGSGRAADLLAFTHKYAQDDGTMPDRLKEQLIITIEKTFQYNTEHANKLFLELMLCVKKKELITVFRMGEEGSQDIDLAILTALLTGQNASPSEQLSLALTWDRVDIAKSHIFVYGQEWPEGSLEQAMMDALIQDRVDFVKLLLQNGVSMKKFLTIQTLEELYNSNKELSSTFHYLMKDKGGKSKVPQSGENKYTLIQIGEVIDSLMGGAYRSNYNRKKFKTRYYQLTRKKGSSCSTATSPVVTPLVTPVQGTATGLSHMMSSVPVPAVVEQHVSNYPFHELLVWAVLMKRQNMAMCMWQHGEEAMAKALVACCLYRAMAHEAAQDDLEVDVCDELKKYALEFQTVSFELLEQCYKQDDYSTQQLLTYELANWSRQTCLSLAIAACHREFVAHTCCQMLLTDMWMGGLRMRKSSALKVIFGILFPPSILMLEFKSQEELKCMPQTLEEHIQNTDASMMDTASESSLMFDYDEEEQAGMTMPNNVEANITCNSTTQLDSSKLGNLRRATSFASELFNMARKKKSPLKLGERIYEFYASPITKFWLHTLGYIAFMMIYTYTVLVKWSFVPMWQEIYVICYVLTLAVEKIREFAASEPVKFNQKLSVFFGDIWNIVETVAIVIFIVGFLLRVQSPDMMLYGRVIYCFNIVFWYIKILDLFSIHKSLGPFVNMIGKMLVDMMNFIVILLVVLMSFGVARQAILFPDKDPKWSIARDVFLMPYFMLYGEVYAPDIDPPCGETDPDGTKQPACIPGAWITPALMTIYLLVANILLLSFLISLFNSTFAKRHKISSQVWKFLRYSLVIEFEQKTLLPPPLIVCSHVYLLIKYIQGKCQRKQDIYDNGLKLFLRESEVEMLHDFEEECMEDYFRDKRNREQTSTDERMRQTTERVENMMLRMDDINHKENSIKLSLQTVDYRLAKLEDLLVNTTDVLTNMQTVIGSVNQHLEQGKHNFITSQSLREVPDHDSSKIENRNFNNNQAVVIRGNDDVVQSKSADENSVDPLQPEDKYCHSDRVTGPAGKKLPLRKSLSVGDPHSLPSAEKSLAKVILARGGYNKRASSFNDQQITSLPGVKGQSMSLLQRRTGLKRLETLKTDRKRKVSWEDIPTAMNSDNESCKVHFTLGEAAPSSPDDLDLNRDNDLDSDIDEESRQNSIAMPTPFSTDLSYYTFPNISHISEESPSTNPGFMTPILNPLQAEYTTITDEIDTMCLLSLSPGSPPSTPFFPAEKHENPETEAIVVEKTALKNAEETEHKAMEHVIRNRIRQISITESDSLSDDMLDSIERNLMSSNDENQADESCVNGSNLCNGDRAIPVQPMYV